LKSAISSNPLDALVPNLPKKTGSEPHPAHVGETEQDRPCEFSRFTTRIPTELMERTKNAVYWTPGETLASVIQKSISSYLDKLEKSNGGPFKQRESEIRPGRPLR
jgi:hypothetical protein